MLEWLGGLAALVAVVGGSYKFYTLWIHPRLSSSKFKRFYSLVQDWFDAIDASNISDLDIARLEVQEKRIDAFLRDSGLDAVPMAFSRDFRRQFLEACGIKEELRSNPELFEKFSRCPANGTDTRTFWVSLLGAFYQFKGLYDANSTDTNLADVEMRVKLLKLWSGAQVS